MNEELRLFFDCKWRLYLIEYLLHKHVISYLLPTFKSAHESPAYQNLITWEFKLKHEFWVQPVRFYYSTSEFSCEIYVFEGGRK